MRNVLLAITCLCISCALDNPTPDPSRDSAPDAAVEDSSVPDTGPTGYGDYPEGPYGVNIGDTYPNYPFDTPEGPITLNDLRQDNSQRILLIYAAGTACMFCGRETDMLISLYPLTQNDGLAVFGVLALDETWGIADVTDATTYFQSIHQAPYAYGVLPSGDISFVSDYFPMDDAVIPFTVIVDLETMVVLDSFIGFNANDFIDQLVASL